MTVPDRQEPASRIGRPANCICWTQKICNELKKLTVHKANYEELRDFEEREKRKEKEHGRE